MLFLTFQNKKKKQLLSILLTLVQTHNPLTCLNWPSLFDIEVLCSIGIYPYFTRKFDGVFSGTKIPRKCSKRTRTLVNRDKYQHRMHVS